MRADQDPILAVQRESWAEPPGTTREITRDGAPRSADAVAARDSRVVPVDRKRFELLVQQDPFFAVKAMGIMADRLRQATRQA